LTKDIQSVETTLIKYKALINTLCRRRYNEYVPLHKTPLFYAVARLLKKPKTLINQ
jgi:hypothetical protein